MISDDWVRVQMYLPEIFRYKDKKMKKDDEKEMKEHEEDEKKKMADHINVDKEGNMIVKIDDWKAMEERIAKGS